MTENTRIPRPRRVPARSLDPQERTWIREILDANVLWSAADADLDATRVVAECDCGCRECRTVYLNGPPIPGHRGTKGYIGRIAIRADNDFGIDVSLDQLDGKLYELYVMSVDLSDDGTRPFPHHLGEIGHVVIPM